MVLSYADVAARKLCLQTFSVLILIWYSIQAIECQYLGAFQRKVPYLLRLFESIVPGLSARLGFIGIVEDDVFIVEQAGIVC